MMKIQATFLLTQTSLLLMSAPVVMAEPIALTETQTIEIAGFFEDVDKGLNLINRGSNTVNGTTNYTGNPSGMNTLQPMTPLVPMNQITPMNVTPQGNNSRGISGITNGIEGMTCMPVNLTQYGLPQGSILCVPNSK